MKEPIDLSIPIIGNKYVSFGQTPLNTLTLMKVCVVASQILGADKVGGFGSMSLQLANHLHTRGINVVLLLPAFKKIKLPPTPFKIIPVSLANFFNLNFYRNINADIYHSQNQHIIGMIISRAEPEKTHIVTCRDPRDLSDWRIEFVNATLLRRLKIPFNYFFEESLIATRLIRKATIVAVPARFLIQKVQKMYGLNESPSFLPNIESIPRLLPQKSLSPVVIWVGRFSKRKHPERFIKIAKSFPNVEFHLIGKAEESHRGDLIKRLAGKYTNVRILGFKNKFEDPNFYDIYNRAWVIVNTSSREGLPLTFIEAAGRGCAVLSESNPDEFASKFGFWAKDRNFEEGLRHLLHNNRWRALGARAHTYALETYEAAMATDAHIQLYQNLLKTSTVLSND